MKQDPAARELREGIDADGTPLVYVPLANSDKCATVAKRDYKNVLAMGVSPFWQWNTNGKLNHYVRAGQRVGPSARWFVSIARMIVGAQVGERVTFKDSDPTNLRRSNLRLTTRKQC